MLSPATLQHLLLGLGRRVFSRGSDLLGYQLSLLVRHAFGGRIPTATQVSDLFQTTLSTSRTLIRNTLSRYRYELSENERREREGRPPEHCRRPADFFARREPATSSRLHRRAISIRGCCSTYFARLGCTRSPWPRWSITHRAWPTSPACPATCASCAQPGPTTDLALRMFERLVCKQVAGMIASLGGADMLVLT